MDIRRFIMGDSSAWSLGFSSIVFTTGFTTAVILPFYLYLFGAGIFWEFIGIAICLLLVWNIESYPMMRYARKTKGTPNQVMTLPGYFEYRFKAGQGMLRLFAAVEIVVLTIVLAALFVKELCHILSVVNGFDEEKTIAVVVLIVALVVGFFGIDYVFKTAWIKAAILLFGILTITFYMYFRTGSDRLMRNLMSSDITGSVSRYLNVLYHDGVLLGFEDYISLISMGLLASGMPFMLGLFFTSKRARYIKKGKMVMVIYGMLLFVSTAFMGGVSRGFLHPNKITNSLSEYVRLIYTELRADGGFGSFAAFLMLLVVIVGFVTAIEGSLHVIISSVYEDIIIHGRLIRVSPKNSKRNIVLISFFMGFVILLAAAYIEQMSISIIITFIATLGCSISPTIFLSTVWKRMNKAGCMAGLVAGLVSVPFFKFAPFFLLGGKRVSLCDILGINSVLPSMLTTILFIVLISILTGKPEEEVEKQYLEIKSRIIN